MYKNADLVSDYQENEHNYLIRHHALLCYDNMNYVYACSERALVVQHISQILRHYQEQMPLCLN